MIATFLVLILFAASSGLEQAILFSRKGAEAFKWNEHFVFFVTRCALVGIAWSAAGLSVVDRLLLIPIFALCFSMPHNEVYYYSRAKIDRHRYTWGYKSATSTAWLDLNTWQRTVTFIGALLLLYFSYWLK